MNAIDFSLALPDEARRNELLQQLIASYPFASCKDLGASTCGRPIPCIRIGNETEMVCFVGAFHGMEWLTSLLLLQYAFEVCESVAQGTKVSDVLLPSFLQRRGLLIIPCINPDGVEISLNGSASAGCFRDLVWQASKGKVERWQANARGVDLNHNFNAGWEELHQMEQRAGICCPGPTRYGGKCPESEVETRLLTQLCRTKNIRHALAFHSQGEEIYWDYGDATPKNSELMARVMAVSSGYTLAQPQGLAVGGGFKDWFIQELHKPAFTIEIGKGANPLPLCDLEPIYNTLLEMLVLSTIM